MRVYFRREDGTTTVIEVIQMTRNGYLDLTRSKLVFKAYKA